VVHGYDTGTVPTAFLMNMAGRRARVAPAGRGLPHRPDLHLNIAPAGVVRFVGAATSGDGTPAQRTRPRRGCRQRAQRRDADLPAGSDNPFAGTPSPRPADDPQGVDVTIRPE